MPSPPSFALLPAGGLEAWQPASLAQRFGDRLFRVTKPFLAGGTSMYGFSFFFCFSKGKKTNKKSTSMCGHYLVP